jgi:salicylate 5-hydroxylase large subunit
MPQSPVELSNSHDLTWPDDGAGRIPLWAYSDATVYARELERIFYGPHWSYVGLEAEIPNIGDFKLNRVGERPVIVVRNDENGVSVLENRCAHHAAKLCQKNFGSVKELICPYHQWSYDLKGNLTGVPFRRGVKRQGGMPADFSTDRLGLNKLQVAVRNGVVFASFDEAVEPFEAYLGPTMLRYFDRLFDGRALRLHGYSRQRIPANWKLMQENLKDPYHASLLHVFFVTFGLFRADQKGAIQMDDRGRHCVMSLQREVDNVGTVQANEATQQMRQFQATLKLQDPRIFDVVREWPGKDTVAIQTLFPNLIIQQQSNSLTTRQMQPNGPDSFDFVWTHFGYADDSEEMLTRRLRQANMFGPAGYVSVDDSEILQLNQEAATGSPQGECFIEMGGVGTENTDHVVTEAGVRAMYRYYREIMEF